MKKDDALNLIKQGQAYMRERGIDNQVAAMDLSFKSLEAWDIVRENIKELALDYLAEDDYNDGIRFGLLLAYKEILKQLKEIED